MIEKDFTAGAAGTRVPHRPEVVLGAHPGESIRVHPHRLQPDFCGFVVVLEHRNPESLLRKLEHIGEKFPGKPDGVFLEVVAEAEIAEHLEKRVVTCCVTHVFEVVVFTAGTNAALRGHSPVVLALVVAEKYVLELHHSGIREQQRRIIAGDERRARDNFMAVLPEEFQEGAAQLVAGHLFHL